MLGVEHGVVGVDDCFCLGLFDGDVDLGTKKHMGVSISGIEAQGSCDCKTKESECVCLLLILSRYRNSFYLSCC